jgi:hypothetical protein
MIAIPSMFYGTIREVRPRAKRWLRNFAAGPPIAAEPFASVGRSTVFVLDDPYGAFAHETAVQMYSVMETATERPFLDTIPQLFDYLLGVEWGPLALMGSDTGLVRLHRRVPSDRWPAFLRAVLKQWPNYEQLGTQFTVGGGVDSLWSLPTQLKVEFGLRGFTSEELRIPPPEGGLSAFFSRHRDRFVDVLANSDRDSVP